MISQFFNRKRIIWHLPVILFLFITGCKGCCNKPTEAKTEEQYQIVSNTHGEIEKIIIRSFASGVYLNKYYLGLISAIPAEKVIGIDYNIPSNHSVIQALHAQNASYPSNFAEVLRHHMGDSLYDDLEKKYANQYQFKKDKNRFADKATEIAIRKELEQEIALRVINYSADKLKKLIPPGILMPKLMASVNLEEQNLQLESNPSGTTLGWLQDVCHALQKFNNDTNINLVYSSAFEAHKNTVKKILDSLPYIDTTEVDYISFDGGNIIPSENYVLVGENILHNNPSLSEDEFKDKLKKLFNVDHVIFAGIGQGAPAPGRARCEDALQYQPIFHIDMFLTPAGTREGNNLILLGLIDTTLYKSGILDETHKQIISKINRDILQTANRIKNDFGSRNPKTPLANFVFDTIPFFVKFGEQRGSGGDYYCTLGYASYNNAIVEIKPESKTIYLPDYTDTKYIDFDTAKQKVIAKYTAAGFDTIKFLSPPADSLRDGALHCYTKVIWRKNH